MIGFQMVTSNYWAFLSPEGYLVRGLLPITEEK